MKGLRFAGGTQLTRCCGREALVPREGSAPVTDNDVPITESNFPDAEYVCPSCARTFPDGCNHENVTVEQVENWACGDKPSIQAQGTCHECDQTVWLSLQVTDAREMSDDWDLSDHHHEARELVEVSDA